MWKLLAAQLAKPSKPFSKSSLPPKGSNEDPREGHEVHWDLEAIN